MRVSRLLSDWVDAVNAGLAILRKVGGSENGHRRYFHFVPCFGDPQVCLTDVAA